MGKHLFWDLGEEPAIHPSKNSLYKILDAIIRLHGKIHCTHCMELDSSGEYRYPVGVCAVLFRISLPEGAEVRFTELTGFALTKPPQVGIR